MIVRKCDICGKEMSKFCTRYKLIYDTALYTMEKDVCVECFERIANEIRQDENPDPGSKQQTTQTDCSWADQNEN